MLSLNEADLVKIRMALEQPTLTKAIDAMEKVVVEYHRKILVDEEGCFCAECGKDVFHCNCGRVGG